MNGPWEARKVTSESLAYEHYHIFPAGTAGSGWRDDEYMYVSGICTQEDAQLIAAAPDLLAALEGVLRVADRATVEFDDAKAAIAKARGES